MVFGRWSRYALHVLNTNPRRRKRCRTSPFTAPLCQFRQKPSVPYFPTGADSPEKLAAQGHAPGADTYAGTWANVCQL